MARPAAAWRVGAAVGFALAAVSPPLLALTIVHVPVPFAPGEREPAPVTAQPSRERPRPAAAAGLPAAIDYNGETIAAPSADAMPRDGEPILKPAEAPSEGPEAPPSPLAPDAVSAHSPPTSGSGAAPASGGAGSGDPPPGPRSEGPPDPTRSDEFRPDGDTGADPILKYQSVFRPSVAPFKRFDVKDAVAADFTLRVRESRLGRLPVGGAPDPRRERFFGSVVIAASDGASVPIPSVAADARILRVQTTPADRRVVFKRDGAGNDYVEVSGEGTVRVNWLTDAPRRYFGGPLPTTRVSDVPPHVRPVVPANVREAALAVLGKLKVPTSASSTIERALTPLVSHFRAYTADSNHLGVRGLALFQALALRGAGACRHRAYAFTILAQTLGIPTRFVGNEAHAFVESWLPGAGWRRLDLGGVSPELQVFGKDRIPHRPAADPFPRPAEYQSAYSVPPAPPAPLPGQNAAEDLNTALSANPPALPDAPIPAEPPSLRAADPPPNPSGAVAPTGSAEATPAQAGPAPTRIELSVAERDALRGDALAVQGRVVTRAGAPAANQRIDLVLHEPENGPGRRRLGVLVSDADGRFTARLPLPSDLAAGAYNLVVSTPGDEKHQASTTD